MSITAKPSSDKRKFLVAEGNDEIRQKRCEEITALCPQSSIVQAKDGSDATFKINNDIPHILIADQGLAKVNGIKLVEWLFKDKYDHKVACILMGPTPATEILPDQLATGQVQFLEVVDDNAKMGEAIQRALNFVSAQSLTELKVKQIPAEQVLIKQGDKADSVYILKKGSMMAYVQKDGKDVALGKIEAGEFVGEMAYITGEARSAHVKSLEACDLIEIPVHLLDHVLFTKPAWAKALMRTLTKRVKTGNIGKLG